MLMYLDLEGEGFVESEQLIHYNFDRTSCKVLHPLPTLIGAIFKTVIRTTS